MLSNTSITSAYNLASIVSRKGKALGVKEGSALADLLAVCDPLDAGFVGVESVDVAPEALVAEATDTDAHDAEAERIVDLASRAVAFTMDTARNKVNPRIKEVVEKTEAYIDANRMKRMEPLLIEPVFTAPIYETAELGDLIAKFSKAQQRDIEPIRLTAQYGDADLMGPLMTGITSFDAEVVNHFNGREDQVKDLWNRYFSNPTGQYRDRDWRNDLRTTDDALVVFLGANALLEADEVPDNLPCSYAAYQAYLAELKEQAASHIQYHLDKTKTAIKSKQLVINAPRANRPGDAVKGVISVHGPVYNAWLAEGGSPEALCGAVAQAATLNYGSILDNAEQYSSAWQRTLNVLQARASFELRAVTIQGLREALIAVGRDVPEDEQLISGTTLEAAVEARLSKLTDGDLENLYAIAQNEVCDLFYPHTDAKAFLIAMNKAAEDRPGLDIKEVALLVAIDYVTGWVSDAIVVADAE
jgi:hypothetical protein